MSPSASRYRPSAYLSAKTLAELLEPTQAQTPYGGQVTTFETLGVAWLQLGQRRSRERTEEGMSRSVETLGAEARTDPRLSEGRVLRFGGGDWTIRRVDSELGPAGRAILSLERSR